MLLQFAKHLHGGDYSELAGGAKHNAGTSAAKQGAATKQLAALRKSHGTLGLADICITADNKDQLINMIEIIRPTLTVFCKRIQEVNTPAEHKQHFLLQASGNWQHECVDILQCVVYDRAVALGEQPLIYMQNNMSLALRLAGQRASTNWALYGEPPFRHMQVLCGGEVGASSLKIMKNEWKWLVEAEQGYALDPAAFKPLEAMHWRHIPFTRLAYMAFELDNWDINSKVGQKLLNDAIEVLPDNKLVEDTHQRLRDAERAINTDSRMSVTSCMLTCMQGGVLRQRGLNDVQVTPECLAKAPVSQTRTKFKDMTNSSKFKTDTTMEKLMHPSTPTAPTPLALTQAAAATDWLYHQRKTKGNLTNGWHASLLQVETIVKHKCKEDYYMVIYVAEWAALACNLKLIIAKDPSMQAFVLDISKASNPQPVKKIFVNDMASWLCIPYETQFLRDCMRPCVGYQQVASPMPILEAALLAGAPLTVVQIKSILQYLGKMPTRQKRRTGETAV